MLEINQQLQQLKLVPITLTLCSQYHSFIPLLY